MLARQDGETWAITATNNASHARSVKVKLPPALKARMLRNALTGEQLAVDKNGQLQLSVPALFGSLLVTP